MVDQVRHCRTVAPFFAQLESSLTQSALPIRDAEGVKLLLLLVDLLLEIAEVLAAANKPRVRETGGWKAGTRAMSAV